MKKKILIFTSTRAEYGLFRNIIKHLELSKNFNPVVVAAGTHLLKKFGSTINELQKDKIKNIISMPFLSGSSDNFNLTSNVGKGLGLFSNIIKKQKPDFIMILGDRFELFIPAITALITNIPLIHIHGGENTTGAMDQQVRNALTKISHIHMPSTMEYAENISKMGEEDWRIHIIGAPGLENLNEIKLFNISEISSFSGLDFSKPTFICTYHPVTLESNTLEQITNVLNAIKKSNIQVVFTAPNIDPGNSLILSKLKSYVKSNSNSRLYSSLGTKMYFSMLKYSRGVIGNSSSGIIESPSFHIPTINIGSRQDGRIIPESVIQSTYLTQSILNAIKKALHDKKFLSNVKKTINPYGNGNASQYVSTALNKIIKINKEKLLKKKNIFTVNKNEQNIYF